MSAANVTQLINILTGLGISEFTTSKPCVCITSATAFGDAARRILERRVAMEGAGLKLYIERHGSDITVCIFLKDC